MINGEVEPTGNPSPGQAYCHAEMGICHFSRQHVTEVDNKILKRHLCLAPFFTIFQLLISFSQSQVYKKRKHFCSLKCSCVLQLADTGNVQM